MTSRTTFFHVAILLCLIAHPVSAAILTVTNLNDSGPGSLRDTIAGAASGDTIVFAVTGTITLTSPHIAIDKNLTVNGPAGGIIVTRQNFSQRIFFIGNGTGSGPTVTMSNLIVEDGQNPHPTPAIFEDGGGIYSEQSKLTLQSCIVRRCRASNLGGRPGPRGGGIASIGQNAELTVLNCKFEENEAVTAGGAIFNQQGKLTVIGSHFRANETLAQGGGHIGNGGAQLSSVRENTFVAARGGAILNSGALEVLNCTFDSNRPFGVDAGGITNHGLLLVRHCTFRDSGSRGDGSIRNFGAGQFTFGNNIFDFASPRNDAPGTTTSEGYNLALFDDHGLLTGPGDQLTTDIKLDPAGLQFNGGPTQTIALLAGSPAIDQGNSFGTSIDQRGAPRPMDNPGVTNLADGSDIGAYEAPADPLQDGSSGFVVTTADDHDDGVAGVTDCTLREAIARSNTVPGPNTITFAFLLPNTITLAPAAGGQLNITEGVTITGPGARLLKISAFTQSRVFAVSGSGPTTISGLTVADGRVDNSNAGDSEGGGIHNQATLALVDCTLDFNRAFGGSGFMTGQNGGSARGGGIFNAGALTLQRCTFKGNGAGGGSGAANPPQPMVLTTGGSAGDGWGGGVYNGSGASLSVINCTFSTNFVYGGNGGSGDFGGNGGHAFGGAIYNLGTLSVESSTLSLNSGDPGGGGAGSNPFRNGVPGQGAGALARGAGTSTLRNTIVAGNTADALVSDVSGAFTSSGFNLVGRADGSTGFNTSTDQTGTNAAPLLAQLGALANNGGPTDTMAPLPDSPAVDAGNAFGLTSDQRGVARPVEIPGLPNAPGGDGSDIGAVELTPIFVTTVDDHDDGACTSGDCTLREAINAANAQGGDDTIAFRPGVIGTIQLKSELPLVSTNMVIAGPAANLVTVRRNTGAAYRIFVVTNAPSLGPNVTISGLTITNGLAPPGAVAVDSGGGILNDRSTLTVRDCVLIGNASNGGSFSYGGGIMNSEGTLMVDRCTFSSNTAYYGGGIANRRVNLANVGLVTVSNSTFVANTAAYGNGIFNSAETSGRIATVNAAHCTFSGNSAPGSFGGGVYSGVANSATANIALSHCTFAGNGASQGSSIYSFNFNATANVTLRSNLFVSSGASNLVNDGGSMTSLGYNLSNDAGAGILNSGTDIVNTDSLLAPLASNGGPTQTHALLAGSPAIDKGRSFFLPFDQRGLVRAADSSKFANAAGGDGADIGAFEVSPFGGIIDSDGDGMPDEYEIFFALHDPNADMDGDGDSNLEEYGNRTDPCDSASYLLRIIAIERSGNDVVITFNGVAGRTFRLERKDELTDPTWMSIAGLADLTPLLTGNAQLSHVGGLSIDHSFYRVRLLP